MPTDPTRAEYTVRIHRVMDHIEAHLGDELTLEALAQVAHFSPFHFHRIFRAMVGETTHQFVQRVRLERAAGRLYGEPHTPVTDIALDLGFSSPSVFARAFKRQFGVSASEWREQARRKNGKADRKMGQTPRKLREAIARVRLYIDASTQRPKWEVTMEEMNANVEVVERPDTLMAYVRHVGPYQGDSALFADLFARLFRWAGPQGLLGNPGAEVMCIYHDNPDITEPDKHRVSVCLTARPDTQASGEVNLMTVPGGRYAVGAFNLRGDEYAKAWESMYGGWLPESGFVPGEGTPFEVYDAMEPDADGRMAVRLFIPVREVSAT